MRVKICGITSHADAMAAIHAGADALGFVFYPPSPRYIAPEEARRIIDALPPFVEKVGLFVNESADTINDVASQACTTLSQLHFDTDETLRTALDHPYIPVVRAQSVEDVQRDAGAYRLVDAYCEAYGGMGKRLNLEWFEGVDCSQIILAGGLDPDNVAECRRFGFYGVDVSSGVEARRGVKSEAKVRAFVSRAKAW